ncbi:type II toxin-antitoxin system RelE/ParE family toxin [Mucilaginibacter glaciei]|uniref:Type II toxin-antitoxin system RelE/ParE family toxin n=1 Tax=Mucilaginibacter glaciei TaxID=2772109 RepID=A0A926NKQ6_9SPHI|nr:type II toxin-antitoxin system RelE/ParE family toxin [Mucilaginibacter glaciei]
MGFEIIWTPKALNTFGKRINYLEKHWTEKELVRFTSRVNDYLLILKEQPLMFRQSYKVKHTHIGVIIKEVSLIYRVKPRNKIIELIAFIDNRQNPKSTPA